MPSAKQLAKLAETLGLDLERLHEASKEEPPSREAEAVLANRDAWYSKSCKGCSRRFETDFRQCAFCSDRCRKIALREQGINWDPTKTQAERWAPYEVPMIVGPDALQAITTECYDQLTLF